MPVTARLSKLFYERLGEQIANELVEWFNSVDATYRADLRELNELNFARFDAKLEQRLGEMRSELLSFFRTATAELKSEQKNELHQLRTELYTEIQSVRVALNTELQAVRVELNNDLQAVRVELKTELQAARVELKTELQSLRSELKTEQQSLKADLVKWMFLFWAGTALAGVLIR